MFMTKDIYAAFGNKTRAELIRCLAKEPKNVTQLISTCGLSQSAVSQHLAKLRQSGLVETKKNGKNILYQLKFKQAAAISQLLSNLNKEVV